MKTLSVRFYKRLILVILALLIAVPTALAIVFGVQNAGLRKALAGETGANRPDPGVSQVPLTPEGAAIDYQLLYPELYSSAGTTGRHPPQEKTAYLTFDCTPGENTRKILDALDEYGVKATFFVGAGAEESSLDMLREIVERGHAIGLRCYSDSYQTVYQSVTAYLDDFQQIYDLVYEATGVRAEIFRFPGGSINAYNSGIYQELIAEMLRRGFIYFDWNVSGEDTRLGGLTAEQVSDSVLNGMEGKDWGIIALRDAAGKGVVAEALPAAISGLKEKGYDLQPLTAEVMPVIFSYKNAP